MLTKETNPPMPNLGPPNISGPPQLMAPSLPQKPPGLLPPSAVPVPFTAPSQVTDPSLPQTPKAVVKPQVLTHVIDGHVIKESSAPFPLSPSKTAVRRKSEKDEAKAPSATPTNGAPPNLSVPVKRGPGRPPGSINKQKQQQQAALNNINSSEPPEKKLKSSESVGSKAVVSPIVSAPLTPQAQVKEAKEIVKEAPKEPKEPPVSPKNNPLKWNVQQVCDFIKALPGCSDYVEDFAVQEIDGQALMLLQADHLMSAMSIKLGPALKICQEVKSLKDELAKN